jgi:hypothetical protein
LLSLWRSRGWPSAQQERLRDLTAAACHDMNVIGLENAAEVGFIRGPGAEALDRRLFVPECFKERERKALGIERLVRELLRSLLLFRRHSTVRSFPWAIQLAPLVMVVSDTTLGFALLRGRNEGETLYADSDVHIQA